MDRRIAVPLLLALVAIPAGAWWALGRSATPELAPADVARGAAAGAAGGELERLDRDIAFFRGRVARDPEGATDRTMLAGLLLQHGRETGDYHDAEQAEALARASLAIRTSRNSRTFVTLASALMTQHRFAEALDAARAAADAEPGNRGYLALVGEVDLELGRYEDARRVFQRLLPARDDLAVAPRLARWAEIEGNSDAARRLLYRARATALARTDLPREQVAWFDLRIGDLELRNGRLAAAEAALRDGLVIHPGDYRILAAMARLAAARHQWRQAAAYGEASVATMLDPATLGLVSDAYAALGDSAQAAAYAHAVELSVLGQPGQYHRAWSLFLLDHGRARQEVLSKVRAELVTRRDVYGYDLLAWALHAQGRDAEARRAMDLALSQGTRDALLFFHAGLIDRALGRRAEARRELRQALRIDPTFHPTQAAVARATLDSLGGGWLP